MRELGRATNALALTRGVEWELLDQVGRKKMVSTAMRGTEAHAKALARTRGVEWESLDHSGRAEIMSAANSAGAVAGQRTEAIEACALKIAHSQGKDWSPLCNLTQKSYRDKAETVCHNCFVGGSAPQTQKDAFHNLLTGAVRHWMGEDYFGDWMVARKNGPNPPFFI